MNAPAQAPPAAESVPAPSRPWRIVISLLLALHVTAVFVAPFAAATTSRFSSSPLSDSLWIGFRPYLQAAFLNHGYKFFAPDPGPGHLVRYELELPDGTRREGIFPNLKEQQPRLLYHRYMMLADRLPGRPEATEVHPFARSYGEHLLKSQGAKRVTLYLVTHVLATPDMVRGGMKLDDPSLYREQRLVTIGDAP